MDIEKEIEEIKQIIIVLHNELFQANKLPSRLHALEQRIKKLENKFKLK